MTAFLSKSPPPSALSPRHSPLLSLFLPRIQRPVRVAARYRRYVSETSAAAPEATRWASPVDMGERIGYRLLARPHLPPPRWSISWACLGAPRQNEEQEEVEGKVPQRRGRRTCCRRSKPSRGGEGVTYNRICASAFVYRHPAGLRPIA